MPTLDEPSRAESDRGLPPSPTSEEIYEDEDDLKDPHAALVDHVRADNRNNREALAYLLRYETMVRQQEAEDMATLAHLRPCLERLQELLPAVEEKKEGSPEKSSEEKAWTKQISYGSLRKALDVLELQGPTEFMTTDRQLMMILRLLTQSSSDRHHSPSEDEATLTWAELVQCYKTCIVGMTSLQHLPHQDDTRQRARDRTLAMLALFEPQSRLWSSPLAPVRPAANTTALHSMQRSSFAPPRAVSRRRKTRRQFLLVALVALLTAAAGMHYYQFDWRAMVETILPQAPPPVKTRRKKSVTSKTAPPPSFSARSRVLPSLSSTSARPSASSILEEDEEEVSVAASALVAATIGTPLLVAAAQAILKQSGSSLVLTTASMGALGASLVSAAGILSLASLVVRSLKAVVRGLR
jgi:hypothetical protein